MQLHRGDSQIATSRLLLLPNRCEGHLSSEKPVAGATGPRSQVLPDHCRRLSVHWQDANRIRDCRGTPSIKTGKSPRLYSNHGCLPGIVLRWRVFQCAPDSPIDHSRVLTLAALDRHIQVVTTLRPMLRAPGQNSDRPQSPATRGHVQVRNQKNEASLNLRNITWPLADSAARKNV